MYMAYHSSMHDLRPLTEEQRERMERKALLLGKALCRNHPSQIYMNDRQTIGFLKEAAESGFLSVNRIERIKESLDRNRIP